MPWTTPSLTDLRKLNRDYVTAGLGSGALVPNSLMRILADSNAGLAHLVLQYVDWIAKQLLPDTADGEWLRNRHAQIWLGGWKVATTAKGKVTFAGDEGQEIPRGTLLNITTPAGYLEFVTTEFARIGSGGTTDVMVEALTAGTIGNLEAATVLSVNVAITGVSGNVDVIVLEGGTDEETDDELRVRVLQRIRQPPMGGSADDYVKWMLDVPGVTRAWCSPLEMGIGTVSIRFMMDDLRAGDGGFPNSGDVAAVAAYVDSVRPVTHKDLFVLAPVAQPINFTITGLTPDTATIRADIAVAVKEMLHDRAAPGYARNGVGQDAQTIYASWVSEAIYHAEGVEHFRLTMTDAVMTDMGKIATLGTITYA